METRDLYLMSGMVPDNHSNTRNYYDKTSSILHSNPIGRFQDLVRSSPNGDCKDKPDNGKVENRQLRTVRSSSERQDTLPDEW